MLCCTLSAYCIMLKGMTACTVYDATQKAHKKLPLRCNGLFHRFLRNTRIFPSIITLRIFIVDVMLDRKMPLFLTNAAA
jgi:hypothetical protein